MSYSRRGSRGGALFLLKQLDWALQLFVPPRERQIAWISDPDYVGNAYHLYRHTVTARRDLTHVWLVADAAIGARIWAEFEALDGPGRGHRLQVLHRHRPAGYLAFLRSRWSFHTHGVYRWTVSAFGRDCVSLWHGMPVKAIGALNHRTPNPHPTFGTLHLATSHFYRYVIEAAFRADDEQVLLSGLPRCDVLHRPHPAAPDATSVKQALGVAADRRLVLWLPTYRTQVHRCDQKPGIEGFRTFLDDLSQEQWARIEEEAARTSTAVLLKPHPTDPLNHTGHRLDLEHVRLLTDEEWRGFGVELYDALAVTDGLISDLSSVLIDWLPTGRPLGMVGFDPETYPRDVLFPVATLQRSRRVHDLADEAAMVAFFDRVAGQAEPEEDDLSEWLYLPQLTDGSETVLTRVGL